MVPYGRASGVVEVADSKRASLLVVDDEPAILEALQDLFEDDYQIFSAINGKDGLAILESEQIAVVLSDQRMPQMKGEEFLAHVAERSLATRVLLTGYTDFEDLVQAVNRGHIYAFVPKPWKAAHLRSLVRHAVERYQLQRGLLQEKVLLQALMEYTPDLISIKDHEGRYLRLNRAYASALGAADGEELLGKTDAELGRSLFAPPDEGAARPSSGEPELDVTEKALDSPRWFSTTRVVTPESSAGACFQVEISRDITQRLETNRKLEEHSQRLSSINEELSRVGYIVAHHLQEPLRAVGSFVSLLERRDLFREGSEEYVGYIQAGVGRAKSLLRDFSTYLELFAPVSKTTVSLAKAAELAKVHLGGEHSTEQIRVEGDAALMGNAELLRRMFHCLLKNALCHGAQGSEVVITVAIQEQASHALIVIDDDGPGIPSEDREAVMSLFETGTSGLGSGLGLALCQRIAKQHDGRLWLEKSPLGGLRACVSLARTPGQSGAESVVERVLPPTETARLSSERRAEAVLGPAVREGAPSELARVKSFAATAAHDLHEPLRMVSGYLSLLDRREGATLTANGREYLEFALGATERMRALIDGLLDYSVSGKPSRSRVRRLDEVLADVQCDLQMAIADRGAELLLDSSLEQVNVWDLEGRQLLTNLLGNALKYYHSERPLQVRLKAERCEHEYVVSVEDNGVGVPDSLHQAIFEPFVRGDHDDRRRGSGLGLATCSRIVSGWGGRIWCEPVSGGGTRFLFTIPVLSS